MPADVRARAAALLEALDGREDDARLRYFRDLLASAVPYADAREAAILREYARAMRFLYQQEFVSRQSADPPAAVRDLYQRRGFSTDTAVEAGFVVYSGLGIFKALDPERRVRRVLIVGPGMDLAPRTAFVEGPAESYQPWAVIDALLALGLADEDTLDVVAADINPRVVAHLRRARSDRPTLSLWTVSGDGVELTDDYRDYFGRLGSAIRASSNAASGAVTPLSKSRSVAVRPEIARLLRAVPLDIVTERLEEPAFDLVIATNVLPYFDDKSLMLAMTNVARMLAPGGVFLHNEPRPVLGEITEALGMPFEQSRHAVIAHVRDAPAPLGDSIWLHRRER
jgi:SAM-dependent methyltransferase